MKYNILYTGIFLDNKSKTKLKNWFKLKRQKELLDNICSDVIVLSLLKKSVSENYLSKIDIGKELEIRVIGFLDEDDVQIALCDVKSSGKRFTDSFLKLVISTNHKKINLSSYDERQFRECNGPELTGKIGYLNNKKEIILKLPDVYEDS